MGCTQSTEANNTTQSADVRREGDGRIESIAETRTATFGGVSVRYAYLSMRGNYPEDENKANQDSYSVTDNLANKDGDAFFGVYDGHGPKGHECSQFVRDNLPSLVAKGLGKAGGKHQDDLDAIMTKAHVECNKKIHKSNLVDDEYSGCTSISVYLRGNEKQITVNNVGDSRAIIGRSDDVPDTGKKTSALLATALSSDQTPWRRDERKRIQDAGGRVLTADQLTGKVPIEVGADGKSDWKSNRNLSAGEKVLGEEIDESGDPPRVFSPHGDYPGLSLTRAFGDKVISEEKVGINAEPEILTRELTPDDKIIFLASDGVWEFLTNQKVIDMCIKNGDPLKACRKIAQKSYELWMKNDSRSDDISMICIFVDSVQ